LTDMVASEVTRGSHETSWRLTVAFMAFLMAAWGWIYVNVPALKDLALLYLLFTFAAITLGGLAYVSNSAYPFAVLGFPLLPDIPMPTLAGAFAGLLWLFAGGAIFKLTGLQISLYTTLPPLIAYLFAFLISTSEESFFRATILPMVVRLSQSKLAGVIITSIAFSMVHWLAYEATPNYLLSAFLFSILVSYLTLHYRTAWPAMVAHTVHNVVIVYSLMGLP